MIAAPELLPCPFCGGKPYLANVAMVGCAYVVCTDCRMQSDDGGQDRVVAAWNTRADLSPAPDIAALVETLTMVEDALSRQSWQWTGVGPHPQEVIETVRADLAALKGGAS